MLRRRPAPHLWLAGLLLIGACPAWAADIYVYETSDRSRLITDHPRTEPGYRLVKVYRTGNPWDKAQNQPDTPARALRPVPTPYDELIMRTAKYLRLDPALLKAVMHVESAFDKYAISHKGARGLMQLMPGTARRYGVASVFDPRQNVVGGARYLRDLLQQFNNDTSLALAGYNAGENAVVRHNGIPPYRETQRYVQKVLVLYKKYRNQDCEGAPAGTIVLSCSDQNARNRTDQPGPEYGIYRGEIVSR